MVTKPRVSCSCRKFITAGSSATSKLGARARAFRAFRPKYTASAPALTAARSCGQSPAGARISGFATGFLGARATPCDEHVGAKPELTTAANKAGLLRLPDRFFAAPLFVGTPFDAAARVLPTCKAQGIADLGVALEQKVGDVGYLSARRLCSSAVCIAWK